MNPLNAMLKLLEGKIVQAKRLATEAKACNI